MFLDCDHTNEDDDTVYDVWQEETHGFNTAVLLLLRHQCFSKNATGTACLAQ